MDLFRFTSGKVDRVDCREKYLYTNNGTMKKQDCPISKVSGQPFS
jgi:hypothetical protein